METEKEHLLNGATNSVNEKYGFFSLNMAGKYIQVIVLLILLSSSYYAGFHEGKTQFDSSRSALDQSNLLNKENSNGQKVDFSLYWKTWNLLKEKYVDTKNLSVDTLLYGSIKGMMESTGDPYTVFMDPEENKNFNEEISGNFEGIGAELGVKKSILTVISPLQGSPAEKAGIRAGDKIIKINGKEAASLGIDEAVSMIRGKKGTSVTLTIFREGEQDTHDYEIQRDLIVVKSVKLEWKSKNIAYISISRFGDDTVGGFNAAVSEAVGKKANGIIIDLRNDPGGYLQAAIDIASKMLPRGKVVVQEEDADKHIDKLYSKGGDLASGIETVVLINEGSASASEILAGALRENRDNVILIGKKSYGKGSVQEFIDMPGGTAAKITVARWLTPNGNQINEQGIAPDKEITMTADDFNNNKDPQLDEALNILNGN